MKVILLFAGVALVASFSSAQSWVLSNPQPATQKSQLLENVFKKPNPFSHPILFTMEAIVRTLQESVTGFVGVPPTWTGSFAAIDTWNEVFSTPAISGVIPRERIQKVDEYQKWEQSFQQFERFVNGQKQLATRNRNEVTSVTWQSYNVAMQDGGSGGNPD